MRLIDAEPIEKYIEDGLNCEDPQKRFGHDAIEILTEVHYAPTIAPPPNDPLTLEELREMDGTPVRVVCSGGAAKWCIVDICRISIDGPLGRFYYADYGKNWIAYRRRPEGV